MSWLLAVGAGAGMALGALAGLAWLSWRADRIAAQRWYAAREAARRSVLATRRPQDELEWR